MTTSTVERPSASREFLLVPIAAEEAGDRIDISGLPVEMAFTAEHDTEPTVGDWFDAEWEPGGPVRGFYRARLLVGGIGTGATAELTDGGHYVWVRVTDSPEAAVRQVGHLLLS